MASKLRERYRGLGGCRLKFRAPGHQVQQMYRQAAFGLGICLALIACPAISAGDDCLVYDSNPAHLWNRLHETLFIRVARDGQRYGCDRIDPLYWYETRHLLTGDSHRAAVGVLDEFLEGHGERLVRDPLKRGFLQHDLWTLFDWTADHTNRDELVPQSKKLQGRLAAAIKRLALTIEEIAAMPDNYAAALRDPALAALPRELLGKTSWVELRARDVVAPLHTQYFGGRSEFRVMLRLPGGREATLAYLEKLRPLERDASIDDEATAPGSVLPRYLNLPQFPIGTGWALVRSMLVIDVDGEIRRTPIVESLQLRIYDLIPPGLVNSEEDDAKTQRRFEFVLARSRAGRLRAVLPDERDFVRFMVHSTDPFEGNYVRTPGRNGFDGSIVRETLGRCGACHGRAAGIYSVRTAVPFNTLSSRELWAAEADENLQSTRYWKRSRYELGLLQGLWERAD